MTCYRIYTEKKNVEETLGLVTAHFDGYTVWEGIGYWKGQEEKGLVIEIIGEIAEASILQLAKKIKGLNGQESVLVTSHLVMAQFV